MRCGRCASQSFARLTMLPNPLQLLALALLPAYVFEGLSGIVLLTELEPGVMVMGFALSRGGGR